MKRKNKIIKVLVIGLTYNYGGIETNFLNLYKKIDKKKIKMDFINRSSKPLAYQDFFIKCGSKIFVVTSYYKNKIKYFINLFSILRENKYDIIYCNLSSARYIIPVLCAKVYSKSKIIIHVHNAGIYKNKIIKLKDYINRKIICYLGDYYFSCSIKASEYFYNNKIIKGNKHFIINNFIDIKKFVYNEKNKMFMREKYNITDELVIGHVGRFSECKNQKFLFEIFKYLKEKNIKTKLILIGANQGINIHDADIIFTGMVDNVNEILSGVDVFVFPSLSEGYGIALIEAQLLKIPCIASNNIPINTKISNYIEYLDLNLGVEFWANKILEYSKINKSEIIIDKVNNNDSFSKIMKIFMDVRRKK